MTWTQFLWGIGLLCLLPFAFALAVMSELADKVLGFMERTLD